MSRETTMVREYGEVVTRKKAAKILGRAPGTISDMIKDGRLEAACEGTMVDVRSMARYIERGKQMDDLARARKAGKTSFYIAREA